MKKTLIALTMTAVTMAGANAANIYNQNGTKVDVGGSFRVAGTWLTGERPTIINDGSRVYLSFSQQITQGLSALGYVQIRFDDANGGFGSLYTKYLYGGLAYDKVGQLTFGKQEISGDDFSLADPTEQAFSLKYAVFMPYVADKAIQFKSASWYGLGFEASYMFDDNANLYIDQDKGIKKNPYDNGYQFLLKYDNQFGIVGVNLRALYSRVKEDSLTDKKADPFLGVNGVYARQTWGVAGGLTIGKVGFAIDYAQTKFLGDATYAPAVGRGVEDGDKVSGFQTALTFQATDKWDIYGVFQHYSQKDRDGATMSAGNDLGVTNGYTVGTHYYINKHVMTYVEYDTNKKVGTDSKTGEAYKRNHAGYVGLRVYF